MLWKKLYTISYIQKATKSGSAPFIFGFWLISPLPCVWTQVKRQGPDIKKYKNGTFYLNYCYDIRGTKCSKYHYIFGTNILSLADISAPLVPFLGILYWFKYKIFGMPPLALISSGVWIFRLNVFFVNIENK